MIQLHDYWRSGASYRVRIALNLKGLQYDQIAHDLRLGAHSEPGYAQVNPQKLVPSLEIGGEVLTQSTAILEWLDETYPEPPLLPAQELARAQVRAMAAIIVSDIHPLNNLRVLKTLRRDLAATEEQVLAWIGRWISDGFAALEVLVSKHGGRYAFGDAPTLADCCLVPQLYSDERFGIDLGAFPKVSAAAANARSLPAFSAAHPSEQPDGEPA